MPRPQKIWYWKARKEWCVKIDGIRHRLGPDKKAAEDKFHALMLDRGNTTASPTWSSRSSTSSWRGTNHTGMVPGLVLGHVLPDEHGGRSDEFEWWAFRVNRGGPGCAELRAVARRCGPGQALTTGTAPLASVLPVVLLPGSWRAVLAQPGTDPPGATSPHEYASGHRCPSSASVTFQVWCYAT